MLHNSLLLRVARSLPPFYILAFFFGSDALVTNRLRFVTFNLFTLAPKTLQEIFSNLHSSIVVDDGYLRQASSSFYSCNDFLDALPDSEKRSARVSGLVSCRITRCFAELRIEKRT
jgi:hypothetical protein